MLYIQYSWLGIAHRTCVLRLSGKGIRLLGLDKKMGELGRATTPAKANTTATAKTNTGILHFVQDDDLKQVTTTTATTEAAAQKQQAQKQRAQKQRQKQCGDPSLRSG
jgi:hypothetical protein